MKSSGLAMEPTDRKTERNRQKRREDALVTKQAALMSLVCRSHCAVTQHPTRLKQGRRWGRENKQRK